MTIAGHNENLPSKLRTENRIQIEILSFSIFFGLGHFLDQGSTKVKLDHKL
jgi:hypothetical protein